MAKKDGGCTCGKMCELRYIQIRTFFNSKNPCSETELNASRSRASASTYSCNKDRVFTKFILNRKIDKSEGRTRMGQIWNTMVMKLDYTKLALNNAALGERDVGKTVCTRQLSNHACPDH